MTDQQTWNCSIALEDNWYVLDLEAGTRRASAAAVVDARIAENKQLGQYRDHLVHLLEDAAQWADSVEATFAAMLWEPAGPDLVVGHLTLTIVPQRNPPPPNEDDTPERTAERLARQRSADPGTEPPEVRVVDLPAGRAAYVRQLTETRSVKGQQPYIVDVWQYWLPVPGTPDILVLTGSTPTLVPVR